MKSGDGGKESERVRKREKESERSLKSESGVKEGSRGNVLPIVAQHSTAQHSTAQHSIT